MAKKAMAESEWKEFFAGFGTLQGVYVAGPDGTPYDYTNVHWTTEKEYPHARASFLKWMDRALARYRERPPAPVKVTEDDLQRGTPRGPDPTTTVVRVFSRVRGPEVSTPALMAAGRDHLWLFADEARALAETSAFPRTVLARLVRFHFLDNGRNVGVAYGEDEVSRADFSTKVIRTDGNVRTLRFAGTWSAEREDREHAEKVGIVGQLEGELDVDVTKFRITHFRAYGEGTAWGDVKRTGAPEGRYRLAFALVEVDDFVSKSVQPFYSGVSPVWEPIYRHPALTLWRSR